MTSSTRRNRKMEPSFLPSLVAVALGFGGLLLTGFQRRRATWSAQSWRRFAVLLAAAAAAVAVALRMAHGVDAGVYDGMTSTVRHAYFYTMLALLSGGALGGSGLMVWFAKGDPERQLGRGERPRYGASRAV